MDTKKPMTKKPVSTVDFGDKDSEVYTEADLKGNTPTVKRKKRFLKAFSASLGVIAPACKKAVIKCRNSIYYWRRDDPAFDYLCKEIEEEALDFAETSLKMQIKDKNPVSTMFFLKTKGRSRGYIETTANFNLNKKAKDLDSYSDDELLAIIRGENAQSEE